MQAFKSISFLSFLYNLRTFNYRLCLIIFTSQLKHWIENAQVPCAMPNQKFSLFPVVFFSLEKTTSSGFKKCEMSQSGLLHSINLSIYQQSHKIHALFDFRRKHQLNFCRNPFSFNLKIIKINCNCYFFMVLFSKYPNLLLLNNCLL